MPDPTSHWIDRVRFSLGTSRAAANALQSRCSLLFHQQLSGDLDQLLSERAGHPALRGGVLRIDRLVLELGDIPAAQFETELRRRLFAALAQKLDEAIANAPPPDHDTAAAAQAASAGTVASDRQLAHAAAQAGKPSSQTALDPYRVLPPEEALTLLLNWLQRGVFAAPLRWQAAGGPDAWLLPYLAVVTDAAADVPAVQLQRWKRALARCCWQPAPLRRLTRTFSRATLRQLAQWLADETPRQDRPSMTQDPPDVWLPLFALLFFQRDAAPVAPAVVPPWPGAHPLARGTTSLAWLQQWTERAPSPLAAPALQAVARQWLEASVAAPTPAAEQAAAVQRKDCDKLAREPSPSAVQEDTILPVSNAGLALLWPMLPRWLNQVGLVDGQRFIDEAARHKAVQWLDALVWGWSHQGEKDKKDEKGRDQEDVTSEWRMLLAKHLCGLPLETLLEPWEHTSAERAALAGQQEQWLAILPRQLSQLQRCSVQDLRNMFLQRPGQLRRDDDHWVLDVDTDASDVLLYDVPWPMTQVVLPWLDQPLAVAWFAGGGLRHG